MVVGAVLLVWVRRLGERGMVLGQDGGIKGNRVTHDDDDIE